MSHWSVIRDLDYRQSKLLASPYHRRSHKNEEMSQLFEKDFMIVPKRVILPSGVREKELHYRNRAIIHERMFQSIASTYEAWRVTTP